MKKRTTQRSIVKILARCLLALMIILFLILEICGYKVLLILSDSMEPVLSTGELVPVKKVTEQSTLQVGDICTYKAETGFITVTHRIIRITPEGYIFKGDHNSSEDPDPVKREQILYQLIICEEAEV